MMTPVVASFRIVNALRGAFVADAAAMGTHWIYQPNEMAAEVPSLAAPEFKDPPTPRFYSSEEFPGHYQAGMSSPYGEQLLFVTEYVAAQQGKVDGATMSAAMMKWAQEFGGRPDSALKTFLENMQKDEGKWPNCGAKDDQAHCFMKAIPVTCVYAGKADLVQQVTEAIRVHQNHPTAVAFGVASSRLLEKLLLGTSLADALAQFEDDYAQIQDQDADAQAVYRAFVRAKTSAQAGQALNDFLTELSHEKAPPDSPFYDLAARSCALPGSFMAPIHQCFTAAAAAAACAADENAKEDDANNLYVQAVRENILVAGDTCSRGQLIGALLGAAAASETSGGPPANWVDKMHDETYKRIDAAVKKIVELATH